MFKRKSGKPKPEKKAKAKAEKKPKQKKAKKQKPAADVVLQKPDTDVYTVMLVISFLAVMIGCILLYLELSRYGSYPWWNAT